MKKLNTTVVMNPSRNRNFTEAWLHITDRYKVVPKFNSNISLAEIIIPSDLKLKVIPNAISWARATSVIVARLLLLPIAGQEVRGIVLTNYYTKFRRNVWLYSSCRKSIHRILSNFDWYHKTPKTIKD